MKLVILSDDGEPVAELENVEGYDLSTTRGRAMLVDDVTLALGQGDRRRVLDFIRSSRSNVDPFADSSPAVVRPISRIGLEAP